MEKRTRIVRPWSSAPGREGDLVPIITRWIVDYCHAQHNSEYTSKDPRRPRFISNKSGQNAEKLRALAKNANCICTCDGGILRGGQQTTTPAA